MPKIDDRIGRIEKVLDRFEQMILGPDGNPQEGIFHVTHQNRKDIAEMRTENRTIRTTLWTVLLSLPLIASVLAMMGYYPTSGSHSTGLHQ